jgi:hypothetical protein
MLSRGQKCKAFLQGFASIFNIFPSPIQYTPKTPEEIQREDWEAIRKDFKVVGDDLRRAMGEVDKKLK